MYDTLAGNGAEGMGQIDDFVIHRWVDAKMLLRELDRDFVDKFESEVRLEAIGLTTPWQPDTGRISAQRLSSEWHRLLEACHELTVQASILQTSAVNLTADANHELPLLEVGKRANYHFRSWFIHAHTLAERTDELINWTAKVYVPDHETRTSLAKRLKRRVYEEFTRYIDEQRNQYTHGARRSWGSAITEDQLWEPLVAVGMTPQKFLDEFHYPEEGTNLSSGKHHRFVALTTSSCDRIGSILQELEAQIPGPQNLPEHGLFRHQADNRHTDI